MDYDDYGYDEREEARSARDFADFDYDDDRPTRAELAQEAWEEEYCAKCSREADYPVPHEECECEDEPAPRGWGSTATPVPDDGEVPF